MNDGWDDDGHLDIPEEDDDLNAGDGWDDDGALDLDDDDDDDDDDEPPKPDPPPAHGYNLRSHARAPPVPAPALVPNKAVADGWDDEDEDDLNLDDDDWGFDDESPEKPPTQREPSTFGTTAISEKQPEDNSFGAGHTPASVLAKESSSGGGWEDDDDLFGDDEEAEAAPDTIDHTTTKQHVQNPKLQRIQQDLEGYVSSLYRMVSSINAVLEFEYNTPQKAHELLEYYESRPNLASYTRSKELPRMEYQVMLPNGHIETNKNQIAQNYLPDKSLVARCSNQSLLADLLHVITGPDLLVRPQFLAICVARRCKFTVHLGDQQRDMVDCACQLHLSLPTSEGERLGIANVHVSIIFAPYQPMVEFRVRKIDVVLKEYSELTSTAEFLNMMEGHFDELPGHEDVELQNAPADIFRDAFLENSQLFFNQSTEGMKSALQEMGSVVNIQSKINMVKGIRKFLPNTDQLLAAELEAEEFAASRQEQHQQQRFIGRPPPQQHHRPPPPLPEPGNRPQSILGGFMSSGWSALAQSVAVPDQDQDPVIYGAVESHLPHLYRKETPPENQLSQPALYRKEEPVHLYRKEEPTPPQRQHPQPTLYRTEDPAVPQLYRKEEQASPRHHQIPRRDSKPQPPPPPPAQNEAVKQDINTPILYRGEEPVVTRKSPPPSPIRNLNPLLARDKTGSNPNHFQLPQISCAQPPKPVKEHSTIDPNTALFGSSEPNNIMATVQPGEIHEIEDGWGDDSVEDNFLDSEETQKRDPGLEVHPFESSGEPARPEQTFVNPNSWRRPLVADVDYNSDDDIIATRSRWINPRPNRPYISA